MTRSSTNLILTCAMILLLMIGFVANSKETSVGKLASNQTSELAITVDVAEKVTPEKAITLLKEGNIRFLSGADRLEKNPIQKIKELAHKQNPHTIVLSCSDSNIAPEIIFDQNLGDLFVVRTAGHTVDENALASIEYAVENLNASLIIVMGHTSCGAIEAAFNTLKGRDAGSSNMKALVERIHPHLKKFIGHTHSHEYTQESWSNVFGVMKELSKKSALLAEQIDSGKLMVSGALYHAHGGKVEFTH